ncbi:iron uptake transporter permease EfeU [Rudaeicoccus suwonensis]|uniref:iron uptake transporter permease EfeU n=1 Tax=Rudaeicoccus suwonensis TaxID=657409 RepID=UPI00147700B6|nr:iron uptake transporter permease EfeU [Rudaeicoccus suwonensis]
MNWSEAVPNLLIGLREGLEAGLIVTILLAAVRKAAPVGQRASTTPVWLGIAGAVSLSLSAATVLTFATDSLSSRAQELVGGILSVLAVCLVTVMIFWMRRTARTLSGEINTKVTEALALGTGALTLTAFLAVSREGLETMLFLWTAAKAAGDTVAPIVGAAIGIAIAIALCILLYRRAVKFNLGTFFSRTAVLLIVIAAGVLAYGLGDLQDAGLLPGSNWIAWDLTGHIDPGSWWVTLIQGVTELAPRMTVLQVVAWVVYLAIVLTTFVLAGRTATTPAAKAVAQSADSAVPDESDTADDEPAAVAAAPVPLSQRFGRLAGDRPLATGAAFVLTPAILAGIALAVIPRSNATTSAVTVTGSKCADGWSSPGTGSQTFAVTNKSSNAGEIMLLDSSGAIAGEIETLGPATTANLTASLSSGSYTFECRMANGKTLQSSAVSVSGASSASGPAPYKPATLAELQPAATAYQAYVRPKLNTLQQQVNTIEADLRSGDMAKARTDWLPAQLTWEQVGAAYDSFGDLGDAIDGLPWGLQNGVNDKDFTGLHRLEYGLWHGQSASTLLGVTTDLHANITKLIGQLPKITIDPTDMPIRAHEILEDAQRDKMVGTDDFGSGAMYPETSADVAATRVVLSMLAPQITSRRPQLVKTITSQLNSLDAALDATKHGDAWRPMSQVPLSAQQQVNAQLGNVLESLSLVPDLLEVPPNS